MDKAKKERFIIMLTSLAFMGLMLESLIAGWEFWVPPLVALGAISLWLMHISDNPEYRIRKALIFAYAALAIFYHGVHEASFFDVALVVSFAMVILSFFDSIYMMNILLAEYVILLVMQLAMAYSGDEFVFDPTNMVRILVHAAIVFMVYFSSIKAINDRVENALTHSEKDNQLEAVDADMEDFLSNISHELRTPVNVVNGLSEMMIKKNAGNEAYDIKNAGIRLAYQIEDIQDYTECKRGKVILEEDEYITTSLINDVVAGFRFFNNEKKLEMVVDVAPNVPTKMVGDVKKIHKIFRHLLENGIKFTMKGGILVRVFSENTDYGVNLCIEMTDNRNGQMVHCSGIQGNVSGKQEERSQFRRNWTGIVYSIRICPQNGRICEN